MVNSIELNKLSRACKQMGFGQKMAAVLAMADALTTTMLYHALTAPGLVIGSGDPAKVKVANTVTFVNNGLFKSKTTAEVAFTPTTHDIAAHASLVKEATFTVSLKADLTLVLTMSPIAVGAGNSVQPAAPTGQTVIGKVVIAVAAGATPFTAGTTQLNNGALTVTYVDQSFRPSDLPALIATLTSAA
jgi:hypothetical protein